MIASDVTNPLLGDEGAAATYGPQKGASAADVAWLDANLAHYADLLEAATGTVGPRPARARARRAARPSACWRSPTAFRSLEVRPGIDMVMELTGFDAALADADIVLTGEGRIDRQTAFGKTALGVARRAHQAGVPCIAFGGGVEPEGVGGAARARSDRGAGRRRPHLARGRDGGRRGADRTRRRARCATPVGTFVDEPIP